MKNNRSVNVIITELTYFASIKDAFYVKNVNQFICYEISENQTINEYYKFSDFENNEKNSGVLTIQFTVYS